VGFLKDPQKFANVKVPKGVLMVGPPGTGKTLMARALAGEAGVPFITASGSEFEEVFVGLGARRIRQLFEDAKKQAPCIIFIDEIDAVGGSREKFLRNQQMSLNQLLVELDGFNGREGIILVGATNMPSALDPALVRPGRFDRKIYLGLPEPIERQEILDYYLSKHKLAEDVDSMVMARQTAGMSGADIENMVNWAAVEAIKQDLPSIDMHLLEVALMNVAMGREKKSMLLSGKVKKITAYHEGGHALVALYSAGAPEIRKATLIPRGEALGMVNYLPNDEHLVTKTELLGQMQMAMGGRAAEELIFGVDEVTTGASSDFEGATNIAYTMVTKLGMSDKIGHVYANRMGRSDSFKGNPELIEVEVQRLLEQAYKDASNLLKDKEKELHLLAAALLRYETLDKQDILKVIKGEPLLEKDAKLKKEKEDKAVKEKKKELEDNARLHARENEENEAIENLKKTLNQKQKERH